MQGDKRRHPRVAVRQRVWCEAEGITMYVAAVDASMDGMAVQSPNPDLAGRRLRMSFVHPTHGEVVADVKAVWSGGPRAGARPRLGLHIEGFRQGAECYRRFLASHREG